MEVKSVPAGPVLAVIGAPTGAPLAAKALASTPITAPLVTPPSVKAGPVAHSILEKIVRRVAKVTGEDSILLYDSTTERFKIPYWISTGAPDLDQKLGGGIAGGRIVEVFSKDEAEGKTSFAATVSAQCQKMGGVVVYYDAENTLMPEYFRQFGLKIEDVIFAPCDTMEQFFELVESLCVDFRKDVPTAPLLFVLDSVAAAQTEDQEGADYTKPGVGVQARVMSSALRKLTGVLAKSKSTLLLINQSRSKIGVMYGDPNVTPGGKALKFYSSQRIALRRAGKITTDGTKDGKLIGIDVEASIVKNKVYVPFKKSKFRLIFGRGVVYSESAWDLLVRRDVITGGSAGRYQCFGQPVTKNTWKAFFAANEKELVKLINANIHVPDAEDMKTPEESDIASIAEELESDD